uniref:Uncharacterized protein n=1 Tax=Trichogramma kaykai TaxID=54128 RepID=A0ABD2X5W7_9HYME
MNVYLLDMQGFRAESKFIIKELAIIPLYNGNIPKLYLLKAPHGFEKYSPKNNERNRWLERHYHRLKWNHGVVSYDKLGDILKKVLRNAYSVYVKGIEKISWLRAYDITHKIIDLESLGCPALKTLNRLPACAHHSFVIDAECAMSNVLSLREWMNASGLPRPSVRPISPDSIDMVGMSYPL